MSKSGRIRQIWDRGRARFATSGGRLRALLTRSTTIRATVIACGSTALACAVDGWIRPRAHDSAWWLNLSGLVVLAGIGTWQALRQLRRLLDWFPTGRAGSILRLVIAGLTVAVAVWLIAAVGPGTAWSAVTDAAVSTLPALFVLVFGVWAVVLVRRWVDGSRHRFLRYATDLVSMPTLGVFLVFVFDRDTLLTRPVAGLLIPVGFWAAFRTWKAMSRSGHIVVAAAADIVLSLLLGTGTVLSLVWLANLVALPRAEVAAVRTVLQYIGSIADVPWWVWMVSYLLLAAAGVLAALRPARPRAVKATGKTKVKAKAETSAPTSATDTGPATAASRERESGPARVLPFVNAGRRVLSGVHIGLMLAVLIAVAAPRGLESTLRGQVRVKYTLAVQRALADRGRQAAYQEIHRRFTAGSPQPVPARPLSDMVEKIHAVSGPGKRTGNATDTERSLARRLGHLQADTFEQGSTPPAAPTDPPAPDTARFDKPIDDAADLTGRLDRLDAQQHRDDQIDAQLELAAESAAVAVASVVQLPDLGSNEILQVVKEYLSGLVESSPLKETFAGWARRAVSDEDVPPADRLVVPDPRRLRTAALFALLKERLTVRVADPFSRDRAQDRARTEPDIGAAVDLANEQRFLVEHRGPCEGCPRPLRPGEDPFRGPGEPGHERPKPPEFRGRP